MPGFQSFIQDNVQNILDLLVQNPALSFGGLAVVASGFLAYLFIMIPERARKQVANLLRDIDIVSQKLTEAQKIGKFGNFTWDFLDPSQSYWSPHMYELCGLIPRKRPPAPSIFLEIIDKKEREKITAIWNAAQMQPGPFSFTFRAVLPSYEVRYLHLQGKTTLTADKKPKLIEGVAHDVSKEMEVDQAKTEFVSLASHQLKTPLTSMRWLIEAIATQSVGPLSEKQLEYMQKMGEANQRMTDMVNDLLNVSRIELGTFAIVPEEFDVVELVKGVIEEQQHTADDKRVTVKLICNVDIPHINADRNLTRMVFQNLISNAIKYTPSGGSVECELSQGGVTGDGVFVRVTDTGIGIPKDELPRVFEKLHRASNALALVPEGTGLGLYLVKTIVEHAGGGISFESTEGKGSTFYVSLPVMWKEQRVKAANPAPVA